MLSIRRLGGIVNKWAGSLRTEIFVLKETVLAVLANKGEVDNDRKIRKTIAQVLLFGAFYFNENTRIN